MDLFQEAMVHVSYLVRNKEFYANNKTKPYQLQSSDQDPINSDLIDTVIGLQKKSYERLEFLGDSVLHNIFADYIFNRYEGEAEGFMTKLRTKFENGTALSTLGRSIKLDEYVLISRYVEKNGGRDVNINIVEDAFEAFTGALYLTFGFDLVKKFIIKLIEKEIDVAELLHTETNFKEKLLQYFHLRKWLDPIYGTMSVSGPENKKQYKMYIKCRKNYHDEGQIVGVGIGQSKKKGEQIAASNALEQFGVKVDDGDDTDSEVIDYSSDEIDMRDNGVYDEEACDEIDMDSDEYIIESESD
jgi:dsRNA-specific ribonuclease